MPTQESGDSKAQELLQNKEKEITLSSELDRLKDAKLYEVAALMEERQAIPKELDPKDEEYNPRRQNRDGSFAEAERVLDITNLLSKEALKKKLGGTLIYLNDFENVQVRESKNGKRSRGFETQFGTDDINRLEELRKEPMGRQKSNYPRNFLELFSEFAEDFGITDEQFRELILAYIPEKKEEK